MAKAVEKTNFSFPRTKRAVRWQGARCVQHQQRIPGDGGIRSYLGI